MTFTVIVPAHDAATTLPQVLDSLGQLGTGWEIIVVDDGSQDCTAEIAAAQGATVVRLPAAAGPSAARNAGAAHARGEILAFVDADVVPLPGALQGLADLVASERCAAAFGAYCPAGHCGEPPVSRFRNLLHSYVHLRNRGAAGTFWSGLGVVRRSAFLAVGGFDPTMRWLEDMELGHRLTSNGWAVWLEPEFRGRHLKRWSLAGMVSTDIFGRAIPWIEHGLLGRIPLNTLNVAANQRLGLLAFVAIAAALLCGCPRLAGLCTVCYFAVFMPVYRFVGRHAGPRLGLAAIALLAVHHACCWTGGILGLLRYHLRRKP